MKKTLLVLLMAGLLLISATACSNDGETETESGTGTETESTTQNIGNDPLGGTETGSETESESETETETQKPDDSDIDEIDPEVATSSIEKVCVIATQATIRTKTVVDKDTYLTVAKEGATFTVTGETKNWYQITVTGEEGEEDQTGYVAKTLAADCAILETFTLCEPVKVASVTADSLTCRSYPSADYSSAIRDYLSKDTLVAVIAEGSGWSIVAYTDAEGNDRAYFVSSKYLKIQETPSETESVTDKA